MEVVHRWALTLIPYAPVITLGPLGILSETMTIISKTKDVYVKNLTSYQRKQRKIHLITTVIQFIKTKDNVT